MIGVVRAAVLRQCPVPGKAEQWQIHRLEHLAVQMGQALPVDLLVGLVATPQATIWATGSVSVRSA
jgi:hypothetical protein